MAGRGPAPKPRERRARGARSEPTGVTVVRFVLGEQPPLPDWVDWPTRTVEWWEMWRESPLSEHFTASDWEFLLDTALLHAAVWGGGNLDRLAELRLRVAKFGATPEDRARLRIQFADADERDGGQPRARGSRERRGALVVLQGGDSSDSPPAAGE